jgi:hypothetical protein
MRHGLGVGRLDRGADPTPLLGLARSEGVAEPGRGGP